jgi:hypothetical protein
LALLHEDRKELFIVPEQIPEHTEGSTAINFMKNIVGLKSLFILFKEEIFEMVEEVLDSQEYGHLRLTFLPI